MRKLLATFVFVCLTLVAALAFADKAQPAPRTWTANGVKMSHETVRQHGKVLHWQRRATGKDGVTKITGVTWGSKVTGTVVKSPTTPSETVERVTVGSGRDQREVMTVRSFTGNPRATVIKFADGSKRTILYPRGVEAGKPSVIDTPAQK